MTTPQDTFENTFIQPIVVAGPPTTNDSEPVTVHIRNITPKGLETRLQERDYQDGSHAPETLSYIVMKKGTYTLDNVTKALGPKTSHIYAVAGTYNAGLLVTDSQGMTASTFTPVIATLATIVNQEPVASFTATSTQGPAPLIVTFDGSASTDSDGTLTNYIWNFGDGSVGSGKTVQHTYTTAATYTAMLSVTDNLGAISQAAAKTITVEETQPEPTLNNEIGELSLTHEWVRVNFEQTFSNPAVFVSPPTNNATKPVLTRIRNLDKSGFEIRLQKWDYQDDKHGQETVSYLVLEQGQTTLPDGTMIEVGTFTSGTKKRSVTFKQAFPTAPVVLTNVVTENEIDAVIGRVSTVTKSFNHLLQEQEITKAKHVNETIVYVAWSQGSGNLDNIHFTTAIPTATVSHKVTAIPFQPPFQTIPFFFSEQQTMNGRGYCGAEVTKASS